MTIAAAPRTFYEERDRGTRQNMQRRGRGDPLISLDPGYRCMEFSGHLAPLPALA